jgi:predicted nucleic acid-binding protein
LSRAESYLDSCVVLSLLLGDSGFEPAAHWLDRHGEAPIWISHWVLLEVSAVIKRCVNRGNLSAPRAQVLGDTFDTMRQQRLSLVEPRGVDYLKARDWLQHSSAVGSGLRGADALHLAVAERHQLCLVTADGALAEAALQLAIPCHHLG